MARKELEKMRSKRHRVQQVNWDQVKKVGILYNASHPGFAEKVLDLYRFLYAEGKQPFTLGYMDVKDEKQLPPARLGFDYFCRKQLNRKKLPDSVVTRNFIDEPFDVLLDLNVENILPLYAVSVLSRAKLKAGLALEENDHLNLTIELNPNAASQEVLNELVTQLQSYLREIYV